MSVILFYNWNGSIACYRCNRICRRLLGVRGRGDLCPGGLLPAGLSLGVFCPRALLAGGFLSGGLMPGWTFVRGGLCLFPQVQCIYAPSRLSVPSIVAWRTNKKNKKRQTRPHSSAGSRPPVPKFSGYVELEAHYIFRPSTIWVRPLFTELGPKTPQKADFAMKQMNICHLSIDIN